MLQDTPSQSSFGLGLGLGDGLGSGLGDGDGLGLGDGLTLGLGLGVRTLQLLFQIAWPVVSQFLPLASQ